MAAIKYQYKCTEYSDDLSYNVQQVFSQCHGSESIKELVEKLDNNLNYEFYRKKHPRKYMEYSVYAASGLENEIHILTCRAEYDHSGDLDTQITIIINRPA